MSEETTEATETGTSEEATTGVDRMKVALAYRDTSRVVAETGRTTVALVGNDYRTPVEVEGQILDPVRFREAMSALYQIVGSDFRYKPKDRTAYLAFQRKQQGSGLSAWKAQQAFFDWQARNDPDATGVLDPVVTAHPDELFVEVFSKDEGTYARLGIDWEAFELQGESQWGTTNLDFSSALNDGLQSMRSQREAVLSLGKEPVEESAGDEAHEGNIEKKISVPYNWIRGFLQVQSSAMLPAATFKIAPIDFYNALRHLRLNADQKRKGRALRVELVPGEPPRLVLEPWQTVIEGTAGLYEGREPRVIRVWGRRRLMLARRFMPFVEEIEVTLLGSGLPSFWVMKAGPYHLTMGLSGFTASNWGQALGFDLLLPRSAVVSPTEEKVIDALAERWSATASELAEATGASEEEVVRALQQACQQGKAAWDLAHQKYRIRPLTEQPLDLVKLEFRNDRERQAHDLLAAGDLVTIESENVIPGVGTEYVGKVKVPEQKREYRASMMIMDDGRITKVDCTSDYYRKHKLKEGPSVPLIALRLAIAQLQAERRAGREKSRKYITVETRTLLRRKGDEEEVMQVSLDRKRMRLKWGPRSGPFRIQSLRFNAVEDAQHAYFQRVDDLLGSGYLDATA